MTVDEQIVAYLLTRPNFQSYGKEIERATGLRHSTVSAALSIMKKSGIIADVPGVSHERCGDVRLMRRLTDPPPTPKGGQLELF